MLNINMGQLFLVCSELGMSLRFMMVYKCQDVDQC